jgi:Histidine kinase-, DNA gyrase B-, and HSP90-like ATPase
MGVRRYVAVQPSAARLTGSLRDIGYDFPSAVADLVDNSLAAGAARVEVEIEFAGAESRVLIADDGCGMTANGLAEALRFGSRRVYGRGDLGRYGLGLKTASLSQCRTVTATSRKPGSNRTSIRQLDLDLIAEWDEWLIVDPGHTATTKRSLELVDRGFSTVIAWENLDRVLPEKRPDGGWAKRRFESLIRRTGEHLGMVFHRFIEGEHPVGKVDIVVNGEKVRAWNPFAADESATVALPGQIFELTVGETTGTVRLTRYVLPPRDSFSSAGEFERMSGPLKWNRQQGLYIYRVGRLVQWSGWAGIRAIDEHTKLARAALDFDTDLDAAFNINVAKMRVSIPAQLRQMLERPINDLCLRADDTYRKTTRSHANLPVHRQASSTPPGQASATAGLAFRSAALQTGHYEALRSIAAVLREQAPGLVRALGLEDL